MLVKNVIRKTFPVESGASNSIADHAAIHTPGIIISPNTIVDIISSISVPLLLLFVS